MEKLDTQSEKWRDFMKNKITGEITKSFGKYFKKKHDILNKKQTHKKMEINTVILKELKSQEQELVNFITYIAESSILVFDNEFNHKLIQFKDIDFKAHPLHNKYVNIIIHYRDDDNIDTFLDVLSSLKEGALTILKFLKVRASDTHDGCGITGTKCLTPRLAIKCFQLLNEELLKHNYKPDGSITTVALEDNKGFMTQRYERMTMNYSTKRKQLTKNNSLTKKKQSTKKNQRTKKNSSTKKKASAKKILSKPPYNADDETEDRTESGTRNEAEAEARTESGTRNESRTEAEAEAEDVERSNSGKGNSYPF